jgi:predicted membrane protein
MKKLVVILLVLIAAGARAQEYKVAKSTGRLELHLGKVSVEGHNGNDIIFTLRDYQKDRDARAEGLTSINSLGLKDNTGLGLNVTEKGDVISVYNLKKNSSPDVKILVPKGVIVSFEHESVNAGTATFRNMENEIEVSVQYNSVELENVSGPLTIRSIYGHVEATLASNVKDPISIVSIYGYVDVTIPVATKSNLRMETSYGEILVDPDFKFDFDGRDGDRVSGKLNGGGVNIDLSCNYGKVYLRKK